MAKLILEDGRLFNGEAFGYKGITGGEVVFNTSMCGYQEILTDPSYHRQIITMTYPLIGNYGVNQDDTESTRVQAAGFIVKELCPYPSSWRAQGDLETYLIKQKIVGIKGIDTRALTRHIRSRGAMRGVISCEDLSLAELKKAVAEVPQMSGQDLVKEVTTAKNYVWNKDKADKKYKIAVIDYGLKHNILRCLAERGCDITVYSALATSEEILASAPQGIVLSNGPGDPAAVTYAIKTIRQLAEKKPVYGICLGHQLLSLAFGGETFKLKFGHRGGNQPVLDYESGKVEITAQNHGFAVEPASLKKTGLKITHINLNDQTVEGVAHQELPVYSVQYHPEAAPGPHDSRYLFDKFIKML